MLQIYRQEPMHFVKRVTFDDKNEYASSQIVDHTNKTISVALSLLIDIAKKFVREELGREAGEKANVIEIKSFDQVHEPTTDGILLYRLVSDPHRIHVYQKKTQTVNVAGWFTTGPVIDSKFKRICIYELEEYSNKLIMASVPSSIPDHEFVPIGPAQIKVPKGLTISPVVDLIRELKDSPQFVMRSKVN
jgi:hypothetical protein